MNNTNRIHQHVTATSHDFEPFAENSELIVEHQPVHSFLQKIPNHKWNTADTSRFGREAGKAADGLHVAYVTTTNEFLGHVRVFPVPMLKWVYNGMASQCGWPSIVEAAAIEDGRKKQAEAIKKAERQERVLQELADETEDLEMMESLNAVRKVVRIELTRLKGGIHTV